MLNVEIRAIKICNYFQVSRVLRLSVEVEVEVEIEAADQCQQAYPVFKLPNTNYISPLCPFPF